VSFKEIATLSTSNGHCESGENNKQQQQQKGFLVH